jgi:hypothetical protein
MEHMQQIIGLKELIERTLTQMDELIQLNKEYDRRIEALSSDFRTLQAALYLSEQLDASHDSHIINPWGKQYEF